MAAPFILQAMWLFLASAASASLDTRSVQQEFPQLAHVIYSICGLQDIDFSVSHPCAYSIFGMAYAFTECGASHQGEHEKFKSCVLGCSHNMNCDFACKDPEVKNPLCLEQCNVVATCIEKATLHSATNGQASANTNLKYCFSEEPLPKTPAPTVNSIAPVLVLPPGPAPAAAAAPFSVASPAPASPAQAAASLPFKVRKGLVIPELGFVAPQCVCSESGIVRGQDTGQPGCDKHQKERNAHVEAYCYVEGGFECGGAMASELHPGLFWVGCEKPNFDFLYPAGCEIVERTKAKLFSIPPSPMAELKVPSATFEDSRRNMAPLPKEPSPVESLTKGLAEWSAPLPPAWHAARSNYFVSDTKCGDLTPIDPADCPANANLGKCDSVPSGELCNGDGECGTNTELDNCGTYDIYRKGQAFSQAPPVGAPAPAAAVFAPASAALMEKATSMAAKTLRGVRPH